MDDDCSGYGGQAGNSRRLRNSLGLLLRAVTFSRTKLGHGGMLGFCEDWQCCVPVCCQLFFSFLFLPFGNFGHPHNEDNICTFGYKVYVRLGVCVSLV